MGFGAKRESGRGRIRWRRAEITARKERDEGKSDEGGFSWNWRANDDSHVPPCPRTRGADHSRRCPWGTEWSRFVSSTVYLIRLFYSSSFPRQSISAHGTPLGGLNPSVVCASLTVAEDKPKFMSLVLI